MRSLITFITLLISLNLSAQCSVTLREESQLNAKTLLKNNFELYRIENYDNSWIKRLALYKCSESIESFMLMFTSPSNASSSNAYILYFPSYRGGENWMDADNIGSYFVNRIKGRSKFRYPGFERTRCTFRRSHGPKCKRHVYGGTRCWQHKE